MQPPESTPRQQKMDIQCFGLFSSRSASILTFRLGSQEVGCKRRGRHITVRSKECWSTKHLEPFENWNFSWCWGSIFISIPIPICSDDQGSQEIVAYQGMSRRDLREYQRATNAPPLENCNWKWNKSVKCGVYSDVPTRLGFQTPCCESRRITLRSGMPGGHEMELKWDRFGLTYFHDVRHR